MNGNRQHVGDNSREQISESGWHAKAHQKVYRNLAPYRRAYWKIAPEAYRLHRFSSPEYLSPPYEPFEIEYVDPDDIVRLTRREYPVWRNRWELFGTAMEGDWDVREDVPVAPVHEEPPASLYLADTFTGTVVHQSLEAHFSHGRPWEETSLVQQAIERARSDRYDGAVWHNCYAPYEVWNRCREMDRLYESIRRRGCLSMRKLNAEREYRDHFASVMINEILVDVSRDGELLLVEGRHRLSIAKILGLDEVPVVRLVRHEQWVERNRDESARRSQPA